MMNGKNDDYGWIAAALVLSLGACTPAVSLDDDGADDATESSAGADTDRGDDGVDDDADDGTMLDVGTDDEPTVPECAAIDAEAQAIPGSADIIFVVDNSGSMEFEATEVQDRLNDFSTQITAAGVDARVVLVSSYPDEGNGICMEPPLGELGDAGEGCSEHNHDDHPESAAFTHVDDKVGSHDAWERLLDTHAQWGGVVRPDSTKHIVVVTDDTSDLDWEPFRDDFLALDPGHADFVHHSVVCHSDCESAAGIGENYVALTLATGGVPADLCAQDFQPVFDALATEVIGTSVLPCEFELPAPPQGQVLDLDEVTLELEVGMGEVLAIDRVDSAAACEEVDDGWHFDDPAKPTTIVLCPQTCDGAQGAAEASVHVGFACVPDVPG